MRIVFMGSPEAVISPLQSLIQLDRAGKHKLVAVVSQPARPVGRKGILTDPPLAQFAKNQNLLVLQPERASDPDFLAQLTALKPDIVITAAYGQILTDDFLKIPSRATINLHPSLLPAYRGATPVPQALLEGRSETGITILFTVKKLDAGAVIIQESSAIGENEKADALTARLFQRGGELLEDALARLEDPGFTGTLQEETKVTYCRKIQKADGAIDWQLSASDIHNRFRAYYPWPGSFAFYQERRIVIEELRISSVGRGLKPGEFIFDKSEKAILVGTGRGTIAVTSFKPAGAKPQDAAAFWNGLKLHGSGVFDAYDSDRHS